MQRLPPSLFPTRSSLLCPQFSDHSSSSTFIRKWLMSENLTKYRIWSSFYGRPSLMANFKHSVPSPIPRSYQWQSVTEGHQMKVPSENHMDIARIVHVHLAELAIKLGQASDVLWVFDYCHACNQGMDVLSLSYRYSGDGESEQVTQHFIHDMSLELKLWKERLPPTLHLPEDLLQSKPKHPVVFELQ